MGLSSVRSATKSACNERKRSDRDAKKRKSRKNSRKKNENAKRSHKCRQLARAHRMSAGKADAGKQRRRKKGKCWPSAGSHSTLTTWIERRLSLKLKSSMITFLISRASNTTMKVT